jgi:hypothetical protein
VAVVALGAAVWWVVERAGEPPIMRRRVNAGSDRYLADRDRARREVADDRSAPVWYADGGSGDGRDAGDESDGGGDGE